MKIDRLASSFVFFPFFLGFCAFVITLSRAVNEPMQWFDNLIYWPSLIFMKSDFWIILMVIPPFLVNALGWFLVGLLVIGVNRFTKRIGQQPNSNV